MNKRSLAILMAAMLCNSGLRAEVASNNYVGQEVVVSATKTLNSVADAGGSSVTVITSKEIEESGQTSVEEVIKGQPGIDIASNGGPGSTTSIFLRGADAKYTLVLIDGVPINDPSDGTMAADISKITTDNIERIEIVRGPASMLYGSGASAGVINIITKKGSAKPSVYAGAEGGSYSTWKAYVGANGSTDLIDYSISASRTKTDGFSTTDERNKCINPDDNSFEKDGYENSTLSGNFGLKLNKHVTLETSLRYTDAEYEYDGPGTDVIGNKQESALFSGRVALKMNYQPLLSTLYYNVSDQNRRYFTIDGLSSTYDGYLYEIGWQGDYALADNNTVSVGINSREESMQNESFGMYASSLDKSMGTTGIFVEDQWRIGGLRLVQGIRYEDNQKFGSKTTWRVAPSYTFGSTTLKCSYATGFRAPSLYELYSPYGNETLSAETSEGWDAGFERKLADNLTIGSTWFRTDYDDRIAFDMSTWKYAQVEGKTKTYGLESFAEWRPSNVLFLSVNYTYTYTKDPEGESLNRRPRHKGGLAATWKASKKATLNTNLQWVGSRLDSGAKDDDCVVTNKLESYFLVNVSASYKMTDNVELYGRIDNLFDEYYEEAWRYATPGRSAYAGVKVTL
ncbi:TonB-dependent receptor [Chlorobaculum parvum NCIB 8327]|uniref:TonB-dependent receptor n=1 Tax=Chlorobaculum parvum (strain DSM 263 / NCIMB 8327) TaxID=517417 RepID=B3QNT7_CHLP8|nr:TonB-dependent receptor [Chlorobaculum parvum]ACF11590.1 TonB-dependent receptor [Chlorobaculum parvum NCIB 8327]